MMTEIKNIKAEALPVETILVADSLTGQIAVKLASEFDKAVDLTSIISVSYTHLTLPTKA